MATEKWLVISNCQTVGLANCLQSLLPDAYVEAADFGLFRSKSDLYNGRIGEFDKLVLAEIVRDILPEAQIDRVKDHIVVPELTFRAYHPDLVYLQHDGQWVTTPLGEYNSAIVFNCFMRGLGTAETLDRFNADMLARCGYLSWWEPERDRLVQLMAGFGIDIASDIRRWGRSSAFMHSINHPRIDVLLDVAKAILRKLGRRYAHPAIVPHDNLVSGAAFAVYPPIAEALGVPGSYTFKSGRNYRPIGLGEFVEGSFASYRQYAPGTIAAHPSYRRVVDHVGTQI